MLLNSFHGKFTSGFTSTDAKRRTALYMINSTKSHILLTIPNEWTKPYMQLSGEVVTILYLSIRTVTLQTSAVYPKLES